MFRHPYYQTAKQAQREQAKEEMAKVVAIANAQADKVEAALRKGYRILEAA